MRVLVVSASKHGATEEIAAAVVLELRARGLEVEAKRADEPVEVESYDAYVVGSAVYAGHWMKEALSFIEGHRFTLMAKPVWLFSSGPIGESGGREPMKKEYAGKLVTETAAKEHRIFAGKLDPEELSFPEKAIIKVVRAPSGDFRNWEEIHAWAGTIAEALKSSAVA